MDGAIFSKNKIHFCAYLILRTLFFFLEATIYSHQITENVVYLLGISSFNSLKQNLFFFLSFCHSELSTVVYKTKTKKYPLFLLWLGPQANVDWLQFFTATVEEDPLTLSALPEFHEALFQAGFVRSSLSHSSILFKNQYINSLVNADSFYENLTNTTFKEPKEVLTKELVYYFFEQNGRM